MNGAGAPAEQHEAPGGFYWHGPLKLGSAPLAHMLAPAARASGGWMPSLQQLQPPQPPSAALSEPSAATSDATVQRKVRSARRAGRGANGALGGTASCRPAL
jgi:hypothetical protein